ncbi:polyphosphate kinase 2 [Riemerella anatipestifer]|uniref:polyphosphate kinase 2 n=1 Tax=Riemerella anatipestifer TaxID=34085 RepID=UPI0013749D0B|nr:polyphosphate kinase 2 [Riemerella anatipestifer]MCW0485651.1 polyphosphate kinase 2 [Riemerella anatipestifer]MDY3339087.1 polyphosphate kinase 2 [Riemerella anatipestifer]MDY3520998.1 polyphosphate kinase 2 [Riemerella anatipestifer]MDY3533241.1 polyphosphate kinase 2 [Riemerella anatipestifer]MDY3535293.1 polyphosphate kinase 2 [Riemerella anatipestifer]
MIPKTDLEKMKTKEDLMKYLYKHQDEDSKYAALIEKIEYEDELKLLQAELVNLQNWIKNTGKKVAIIFEGRDASGKGGTIKRFAEHLNPRAMRIVALNKPTDVERGQWYFRRYIKELPNSGEIVFFDRSWYNRAVVEPVMGFCTPEQYEEYMVQVPEFEHMLYESGTHIIKFWFSVSKDEQLFRFNSRLQNPLKKWKYSPVDEKGQELWDEFTKYKNQMFSRTHNAFSPWVVVKSDNKKRARLEAIRYVLSQFDYEGKGENEVSLNPDPSVVQRYFRMIKQIDF